MKHTIYFLVLFYSVCVTQESAIPPALARLVETERAFARAALEKGIRESFLEYFTDEGIVFRPHPISYKEWARKNPAPPQRPPVKLEWEPVFGDISASGDLGYDTGPFILTNTGSQHSPSQHGYFFTVWGKQSDGTWKVMLDAGILTPTPPTESRMFRAAPRVRRTSQSSTAATKVEFTELLDTEREFLEEATSKGIVNAYLKYLCSDARLHRNGMLPTLGKDSIQMVLSRTTFTQTWKPIKGDVARSADLGYTYGSYEMKEGNAIEKGYYIHIWKRDAQNVWKIVFDLTNPLPPNRK